MDRAETFWNEAKSDGIAFIDRLLAEQVVEELYLDYKQSTNSGNSAKLDPNDRRIFGKAICGFGNSAGGVVIWGIKCALDQATGSDVPSVKVPIQNISRFVGWLQSAISGAAFPVHGSVEVLGIPARPGHPDGEGFAVAWIPASSLSPHHDTVEKRYYIRAGSSFLPTPHDVLAGMFGRKPQPGLAMIISHSIESVTPNSIAIDFGLIPRNAGRGIARDIYVQCS